MVFMVTYDCVMTSFSIDVQFFDSIFHIICVCYVTTPFYRI